MKSRYITLLLALSLWLGAACAAHAKPEDRAATAKAHQQLMQQVSKSGLRGQDLRELGAALKKDNTLGQAVQGALDEGLRGRKLAEFVQAELKKCQPNTAGSGPGNGMGHGNGMGGGMGMGQGGSMGGGMGMGQGGMGQGGMGQGGMGRGGMGMGRGMGMRRGMGMGRGMGGQP